MEGRFNDSFRRTKRPWTEERRIFLSFILTRTNEPYSSSTPEPCSALWVRRPCHALDKKNTRAGWVTEGLVVPLLVRLGLNWKWMGSAGIRRTRPYASCAFEKFSWPGQQHEQRGFSPGKHMTCLARLSEWRHLRWFRDWQRNGAQKGFNWCKCYWNF